VNLGVPGTGPESLPGLFDRLHDEHHGKLVVYLGTDAFWFGHGWRTKAWFDVSYLRDLKYLLSGQTLRQRLDVLRPAPLFARSSARSASRSSCARSTSTAASSQPRKSASSAGVPIHSRRFSWSTVFTNRCTSRSGSGAAFGTSYLGTTPAY